MNSIAALQRAFSKENVRRSSNSSKTTTPVTTSPTTPIEDINREFQQFEGQFQGLHLGPESRRGSVEVAPLHVGTSTPSGLDSPSSVGGNTEEVYANEPSSEESSRLEEKNEVFEKKDAALVDSPYPSPPPTPLPLPSPEVEPALISQRHSPPSSISEDETLVEEDTSWKKPVSLSRTPSQRSSCASIPKSSYGLLQLVDCLPIRAAVSLFILIRKVLGYLGVKIRTPAALDSLLQGPTPSHHEIVPRIKVQFPVPEMEQKNEFNSVVKPPLKLKRSWKVEFLRRSSSSSSSLSLKSRAIPSPSPALSVLTKPKFLVLDLDETLIHSTNKTPLADSSGYNRWLSRNLSCRTVEVMLNGNRTVYSVYKRPWVDLFLKKVAAWYTVIIFTASIKEYADPVIDWLDSSHTLIAGRYFRESCQFVEGSYVKDLTRVDSDLSRICLVDNHPDSYRFHPANGIPIEGFISDRNDTALLDMLPLLDSLRFTSDVRRVLGLKCFDGGN